ncbi:MAG: hypothetical protein K0A98_03390 [Trueperaceae bacterium]|nr:hypothetical protein [Trueperaceae bacterium]
MSTPVGRRFGHPSSHVLTDVQQVCNTIDILRGGRLLFQGPTRDFLADARARVVGIAPAEVDPGRVAFYRSRVRRVWAFLAPRHVVVTLATVAAFVLGTLGAWYETVVLLGLVNAVATPTPTGRGSGTRPNPRRR